MRYLILLVVAIIIFTIVGCTNNQVRGHVSASLKRESIKNGETTTLEVNGKNTGKVPAEVYLNIIPENPIKIVVSYPGSLGETLQPNEDIGTKMITVTGYTDYSSTKYNITVQLINKANNETLDEEVKWLTVSK